MGVYGPVLKRFVGQIWDSPADVPQLPIGVSKAFTDNKRIQKSMQKYLVYVPFDLIKKDFLEI